MVAPAPAEAVVPLHNKLIRLPCSDVEAIRQIEWQLRGLQKKFPSDIRIQVSRLEALSMLGETSDAHLQADSIWPRRQWLDDAARHTFACLLIMLGRFEQSLAISLAETAEAAPPQVARWYPVINHAALGVGDIQLLREHADRLRPFIQDVALIDAFLAELSQLRLDSHFAHHQRIVREAVGTRLSAYKTHINRSEDVIELDAFLFISGDKAQVRELQDRIDAQLAEYYAGQAIEPGRYSPTITTVVHRITAYWATPAEDIRAVA